MREEEDLDSVLREFMVWGENKQVTGLQEMTYHRAPEGEERRTAP